MAINLEVTVSKVTITNQDEINQGEHNVNTCNFTFSSEYANLEKRAIFTNVLGQKYLCYIDNDTCNLPDAMLRLSGDLKLGVYAYAEDGSLRYSPTPAILNIKEGSYIICNDIILDTSDATATSNDILIGKTAYARNKKITGNIESQTVQVTPSTINQSIPNGMHIDSYVKAVTSDIDENIKAENIKRGVNILDIEGTYDGLVGQEKTVEPTTASQVITPDEGYTGLTKVTVEAIETESKIVKSATIQQTIEPTEGKFINEVIVNPILLEEKTVTPQTTQQIIQPTFGKDGISKVTVDAASLQTKTVTPSTQAQAIEPDQGFYGLDRVNVQAVTSEVDENIQAENIKAGVSILNTSGTFTSDANATAGDILQGKTAYTGGQKIEGTFVPLDTSDATAVTSDIAQNKTAYVNGQKITGTIVETSSVSGSGTVTVEQTPDISQIKINRYSPNKLILENQATIENTATYQEVATAINLTGDKIKSGEEVLQVTGTFTSDATAYSNDIVQGKIAYARGQKIEGTFVPLDTSDATAEAQDIMLNKTAYVDGQKITGTSTAVDTSDATATASDIATGKTAYVNGQKVTGNILTFTSTGNDGFTTSYSVQNTGDYVESTIIAKSSDLLLRANLGGVQTLIPKSTLAPVIGATANKIKKDEVICGVTGTYEGTNVPDWSQIGYSNHWAPQSLLDDFAYSKSIYDNWDSSITSMRSMFDRNTDLKYMPLVNTSNVNNMATAFSDCSNLEFVPLLNTHNVTSMSEIFNNCAKLTQLPLLDMSSVTNLYRFLRGCVKLESIPLFDIGNLTNLNEVFYEAKGLKTIPLLNTSNVTTMSRTFERASNLETLPLLDTENVTNMYQLCYRCSALTTVPQLNTGKVTDMQNAFQGCDLLSNESLNNILQMCINATLITSASSKKLSYIGLSSTQATTCQSLPNWDAFVAAGWTTGY